MPKLAHWPILALTLALAGCGGGGGGGGTPAPPAGTGGNTSNVTTIAPGAGPAGSTSTSGGTSSGSTTATGQPLSVSGLSGYPQGIAVSGSTLYVANTNGNSISSISLTDPNHTITPIPLSFGSTQPFTDPTGLAISPIDSKLYVASWNGYIDVIDLTVSPATVTKLPTVYLDNPDGIALSTDGSSLFVASHGYGKIFQISTANGITIATYTYPTSSATYPWDVYADSNYVYATNLNGTVSKWPIASGTSSSPTTVGTFASPAGITGANGYLYVADYQAKTITKMNAATGSTVGTPVNVNPYQPFFLAQDSTYLYFTDGNSGSVNAIPLP